MVFPVCGKLLQLGELKFPYVNSTQNIHVYAHTYYKYTYMYVYMFLAGAGKTNHAVLGCQRALHRGWCAHFAVHLNSKAETSNRMYYDSITSQPFGTWKPGHFFFFYLLFIMLPYFIRYTVFLAIHLRFDCIFICHRDIHHWNSKWKKECMHPFSSYAVFHVNRDAVFTSIS